MKTAYAFSDGKDRARELRRAMSPPTLRLVPQTEEEFRPSTSPTPAPVLVLVDPEPVLPRSQPRLSRRLFASVTVWVMLVIAIVGIAGAVAGLVTVTNDSGDRYAVYSTIASSVHGSFNREKGTR